MQSVVAEFSPTGKRSYQFPSTPSAINSSCNIRNFNVINYTSDPYKLSFWSKGGAPYLSKSIPAFPYSSTNGITLEKSYTNAATGWIYYEYKITNAGNITLSNSRAPDGTVYATPLSFLIDEIRLYPLNSSISTITYDPLIGKTSECDANGRIIYYEYNDLGKLKLVRDENRNVIKAYEYNYPRIFANTNSPSGSFIRSNCPAGYTTNPFSYSISQGIYFSNISQADANQQAQNALNTAGQNEANINGSCIPPNIYALITYENFWSNWYGTYADVIVRFYSDASYSTPVSVSNYNFSYTVRSSCTTNTNTFTVTTNGSEHYLVYSASLSYEDWVYDPNYGEYVYTTCYIDYF